MPNAGLSAQRASTVQIILRQGFGVLTAGIAAGLIGALALTRVMVGLLFGINATDAFTFFAVALPLVSVAMLAVYIHAQRATRVDPMLALREE